eukprot:Blabericola_migrator_1__9539@NODE_5193_length_849_cov_148_883632_g3308_i0_p1_GENE_NODE_5193_length_849_cov_148_883632_g3308_i0NODE_5193_length_849_cov_148_883632_g3308_i0_p1_ORF_typecomplete_len100_score6_49_NODE_5193_length_849_cov_148_883632_g3308_i0385684
MTEKGALTWEWLVSRHRICTRGRLDMCSFRSFPILSISVSLLVCGLLCDGETHTPTHPHGPEHPLSTTNILKQAVAGSGLVCVVSVVSLCGRTTNREPM